MDISPPPSPSPFSYIYLNKEYYKNKRYKEHSSGMSILGILPEEILSFLSESDLDAKIKFKVAFFLSMIKVRVRNGGKSVSMDGKGWVNLKTKILEDLFGSRDWVTVRDLCLDKNFVEIDNYYERRKFSRSYRINPKLKKFKAIRYFGKGKAFNSLLRKIKKLDEEPAVFDSEFEKKVAAHFANVLNDIELKEGYAGFIDFTPSEKIESYIFSCERILHKNHKINLNRDNGRWTHSVSNCPKILRRQLLYKGEPLVDLDYSNMQPWMVVSLYESDCEEKANYVQVVSGGNFYDFFAEKVGVDISEEKKKKSFKKRILRECFFGDMEFVKHYKLWAIFQEKFPILSREIARWRKIGKREFAMLLQKKESKITIDGALNELIDRGIPTLTIHDSFLCLREHLHIVKKVMRKHFMDYLPYEPTIKIDIDKTVETANNNL